MEVCVARAAAVTQRNGEDRILGILSGDALAGHRAVQDAEKALERYSTGFLGEEDLIHLMHIEQSLEEELLGIDQTLMANLSPEVLNRLAARATAVTAAEVVAAGTAVQFHRTAQPLCNPAHHVQVSHVEEHGIESDSCWALGDGLSERLGYATRSKLARARSPPDGPLEEPPESSTEVLAPPPPSEYCPSHSVEEKGYPQGWTPSACTGPRRWSTVYDRTYAWKKRRENKYALEKQRKEDDCMKECTFSPSINRRGSSKADCESMSEKRERAMSSCLEDKAPIRNAMQPSGRHTKSAHCNAAQTICSDGSQGSTSMEACLRLYTLARHQRWRQQESVERRLWEERQQLEASVTRPVPLSGKIYGEGCGQGTARPKLRPLPTGMEECTFHPRTNVHRSWSSSGHLFDVEGQEESAHSERSSDEPNDKQPVPEHSDLTGCEEGGTASGGHTPRITAKSSKPQAFSSLLEQLKNGLAVSASEVNVKEFLKRQATFAENREQKLEEMRRVVVTGPQMSPGSRKILEEWDKEASRSRNGPQESLEEGKGGEAE
eukprot:evm.model.scf_2494.4 EVM.evm.TU.scf_2494.4   scf_2494:17065-22850(+)